VVKNKKTPQLGLSQKQAEKLLIEFGKNELTGIKKKSIVLTFLRQFQDLMVLILIVASVFAFFAGERTDAAIIFGIVILNAVIGFVQEYKAEKAIEALKKILAPKARVMRDGEEVLIDARELVPGDVMILNEGDRISADAELIEGNELKVDEAILTGESVPVSKDLDKNKTIFMGTSVTHGTARALVVSTGMKTEFGKIATLTTATEKDLSPLQKQLKHIGRYVGKITLVISGILFLVGLFIQGRSFVDTLLFAVSVAVAAVPEGLPTTITIALALGVQRLARKNAIVKQLSSVETLGSTTVICSDKTGTLTKNEMTVQTLMLDSHTLSVDGVGYEPTGEFTLTGASKKGGADYFHFSKDTIKGFMERDEGLYHHFKLMLEAGLLCNNARLSKNAGSWTVLGDPTEGALVTVGEKAGLKLSELQERQKKLAELPFDSERKRMSVVVQEVKSKKIFAYVKGAPDSMISLCTHTLENGEVVPLTAAKKKQFIEHTEEMAQDALRTIAVAYKELPGRPREKYQVKEVESKLIFLGVFGMIDPPRKEVKEAVRLTHSAGIRTYVITGDHGLTARAIAQKLGIVPEEGVNVITGEMLNKMSDRELRDVLKPGQHTIFARVSPQHKLRVVNNLKKMNEVVAVTGDGVNDAPALKRADIGVAMGITGTDVSKEAANVVLTDDSFGTIVSAVIEGRTIYENMKKFIFYIFSSNIGELISIFFMIIIGLPAPLTAVMLLIINLLTDIFPALALGIEPVEKSILQRPPRKPGEKLLSRPFITRFVLSGSVIGLATAGAFIWTLSNLGWSYGQPLEPDSPLYFEAATMAFATLALLQMVHTFNSRSEIESVFSMPFFNNRYLILAVLVSTLLTIFFVQWEFLEKYIGTVAMSGTEWLMITVASFSVLLFEETRKFFARRKLLT